MVPSPSKLVDATLGIDIGSTSTRACIWVPSRNEIIYVENTVEGPGNKSGYPSDFPTAGYPFEPHGPVYLRSDVDLSRRAISLKYGFYALVDPENDEIIEQYTLLKPIMERKDDPLFRGRLRQGLIELLTAVNRDVQSNCEINGVRITRIGLSIPAQWKTGFEDEYRGLVMKVFGYTKESIFFHTETEALAHFLLQGHRHLKLRDQDRRPIFQVPEGEDYGVFLFLDFGGHNMNGCIFNLVQGEESEKPSFYRIEDAFGAGGGSEHWTYNIGKKALFHRRQVPGQKISPEGEYAFLEEFNRQKGRLGPSQAKAFHPIWIASCHTKLPAEDIADCFERAHKDVFDMAKHNIEQVSKYRAIPKVVVTGGTAKHPDVQSRLRGFCDAAGIPEPCFVEPRSRNYSTASIAHGVAMAASNCLTIPQFMKRGAAFGLQKRCCPNRGNTNPDKLWEDIAYFLLSQNNQKTFFFEAGGKDEYKIICDPFFEIHPSEDLRFDRCYDVLYLGKSKKGHRSITVSLVRDNGSTSFVIKATWECHKKKQKGPCGPRDHDQVDAKQSPPLPMFFDGGTNCAHVDLDGYDLKQLDFGVERLERDKKPSREETADTKPRGNHSMSTRSRPSQVPPPDNDPADPPEPTILPRSVVLDEIEKSASRPETPPPTRMRLPSEGLEMHPPTERRDGSLSTERRWILVSASRSNNLGPENSRPPCVCLGALHSSSPRPIKAQPPQGLERPILESSSDLQALETAFSSQTQETRPSGHSKPNYGRGKAPRFDTYNQTVTYPGEEGKPSVTHHISQLKRKRKACTLSESPVGQTGASEK